MGKFRCKICNQPTNEVVNGFPCCPDSDCQDEVILHTMADPDVRDPSFLTIVEVVGGDGFVFSFGTNLLSPGDVASALRAGGRECSVAGRVVRVGRAASVDPPV